MIKAKTSFKFILAALAATAALAACTKEPAPGKADTESKAPVAEGSRTIAVSFAPQTKTYLEGLQPKFNDGDSILLVTMSEDKTAVQDTQTVAVSVDPTTKSATLTTTLQGDLTAMYPAKLAELTDMGKWSILISEVQSGRFEDANICRADISADSKVASFRNMFPLLKITPPNETRKLTIKSLPKIGTDGQRTGETTHINSKGSNQYTVTVSGQILSMPDTAYYVALQPGASFENLSFEAWFDDGGTTGAVKGIVKEKLDIVRAKDTTKNTDKIQAGWAYTINGTDWHEYVTVAGRKWATSNVRTYEDYDDYFMWGTTVLAYKSMQDDMVVMKEDNPYGEDYKLAWTPSNFFSWENTPFTSEVFDESLGNEVFTKYTASVDSLAYNSEADKKERLDLCDDAANANWGGAWRMPTIEELEARGYGSLPCNGVMKFKGTGAPHNLGGDGYYWSSSLDSTNPSKAKCLYFDESGYNHEVQSQPRFWGCSVRAIVDEPTIKEKDKKK